MHKHKYPNERTKTKNQAIYYPNLFAMKMKNKLHVLLIDDEPKALKSLEWEILQLDTPIEVVGSYTDPREALETLRTTDLDAVFLDIEMQHMDGFQLLELLEDREFAVIFTTAYDQYGIKAIKQSAQDYLLKPIDSEDLLLTISRIQKFCQHRAIKKLLSAILTQDSHLLQSVEVNLNSSAAETLQPIQLSQILIYKESPIGGIITCVGKIEPLIAKEGADLSSILREHGFAPVARDILIHPALIDFFDDQDNALILPDGSFFELNYFEISKE
jgi:two-component system LytT family response regulator